MLLHALVINPLDIHDGANSPVVWILRVFLTISLIAVDIIENLVEVLLRVLTAGNQLLIKPKDVGSVHT